MIIDDQIANIKLLSLFLQAEGYTKVVTIQDSRLAVSKYQECRPVLILLDIKMPYLNGFEVMHQLHLLDDPLPPSIVALTGFTDEENLMKIQEAGAVVLTKPFKFKELQVLLNKLLDRSCNS